MDQLVVYRESIDAIDTQLVELLGRRYAICREVARLKKGSDIPMMQPGRVEQVKQRCAELAKQHDVDPEFIRELYTLIIGEACRIEDRIIGASG